MNYLFFSSQIQRHTISKDVRFVVHINCGVNYGYDTLMINNKYPNSIIYGIESDITKFYRVEDYCKRTDNITILHNVLNDTDWKWMKTLDTVIKELNIPEIDLLYVSYNRKNLDIFKGASETLKKTKQIILVEDRDYDMDIVLQTDILKNNGFHQIERIHNSSENKDVVMFQNEKYKGPEVCPYIMKDDLSNSMKNMNLYDYIHSKHINDKTTEAIKTFTEYI